MEAVLKKRFGKLGREEKGFTLIELLAVIVIIGIIAVIAIPLIGNILSKSKESADVATARQIYDAARLYVTSELNGDFTGETITDTSVASKDTGEILNISIAGLQAQGYLDKKLYLPSNKKEITAGTVTFKAKTLDSVTIKDNSTTLGSYQSDEVLKSEKSKKAN